jgi:hypothetical protein
MNHKKTVLEEFNEAIIEASAKIGDVVEQTKSEISIKLAKEKNVPVVDIPLLEINPDELRGLPDEEEFCAKEGVN